MFVCVCLNTFVYVPVTIRPCLWWQDGSREEEQNPCHRGDAYRTKTGGTHTNTQSCCYIPTLSNLHDNHKWIGSIAPTGNHIAAWYIWINQLFAWHKLSNEILMMHKKTGKLFPGAAAQCGALIRHLQSYVIWIHAFFISTIKPTNSQSHWSYCVFWCNLRSIWLIPPYPLLSFFSKLLALFFNAFIVGS